MNARLQFRAGALWSLWEMIERYGDLTAIVMDSIGLAEQHWKQMPADLIAPLAIEREPILGALSERVLDAVRRLAVYTDWDGLEPQISRLEGRLGYARAQELSVEFRALHLRIRDDLQSEFFFHVSGTDVPLYMADEPFGAVVSKKFPKAIEDVAEAAKCLALQRSTATVFHLMRVMEVALRVFAKKLKVTTIDPEIESWNKIADHVNKAIKLMPAKTRTQQAKKAKFGSVSAHLNSVRIAWRNEVMHPKQSYSREEAHVIFGAVRAFMIDLATLK